MFLFIYGVVNKPCYNRNLAISELLVNGVISIEQHIKENGTGNFASLKPVPRYIRARYL